MDYVELLKMIKDKYGANAKATIAFGGSYGGMLAAWMRMKHPNVIQGALAASAPILYFQGAQGNEDNGAGFFEVITKDFADIYPDHRCSKGIGEAFNYIEALRQQTADFPDMQADFNLCDAITSADDLSTLSYYLSSALQFAAMVDYPYP